MNEKNTTTVPNGGTNNPSPGSIAPGPLASSPGAPQRGGARPGAGRPKLALKPPTAPAQVGNGIRPPDNIAPALWTAKNGGPISKLPFMVLANVTGFDGWTLTERESMEIAEPLTEVLNAFVPIGSKYAALAALCSTLFVVAGMKSRDYAKWKKINAPKKEDKPEQAKTP